MDTPPDAAPPTDLARIVVPEVVDFEIISASLLPSIDKIISRADGVVAKLAAGIKDDETMALAIAEAEHLRDNGQDHVKKWREEYYMEPWYRPGEIRREALDSRLKPLTAHIKTLMGYVSEYKERRKREADIAKERAEAEARRQREEAERKQREAAAAEARAKKAAEDERLRKLEAEAAEGRRIKAEAEAKDRREREAREAAAAETQRKLKEAEDAQLAHAQVANDEGNGAAKVDTILETPKPISPVLGKAEQAPDLEAVRLEQENAKRVADEKVRLENEAAARAEQTRKDAEAEAFRLRQEADDATAAATASAAAAAATSITEVKATDTTSVQRYKWDLDSDGTEMGDLTAVMMVLKEILDGVVPIEFIGYNRKRPQDFRPSKITDEVNEKRERFKCRGIRAYPQTDEQLKRRAVGGRR